MRQVFLSLIALAFMVQPALAAPKSTDVIGIALGSPAGEVEKKLQESNPEFRTGLLVLGGMEVGMQALQKTKKGFLLEGAVVLWGDDKKVLAVARNQDFRGEDVLGIENLESALVEKHGDPSNVDSPQYQYLAYWAYDRDGNQVPDIGICSQKTSGYKRFELWRQDLNRAAITLLDEASLMPACGTLIEARFSKDTEKNTVTHMAVIVIDGKAAYDQTATRLQAREEAKRKEDEERQKRLQGSKPKL